MERPKDGKLRMTTVLLAEEDVEALRDLARLRARRLGGRVSQGATIRDLIQAEAARVKAQEARRG